MSLTITRQGTFTPKTSSTSFPTIQDIADALVFVDLQRCSLLISLLARYAFFRATIYKCIQER